MDKILEQLIDEIWDSHMPFKDYKYDWENNKIIITHKDNSITEHPIFVEVRNNGL